MKSDKFKRMMAALLAVSILSSGSMAQAAELAAASTESDPVQAAEPDAASDSGTPTAINGMIYATVDMEYADFYYGELNNIEAGTSTTPDLSRDIVDEAYSNGEYDAVSSATTNCAGYFDITYSEVKEDKSYIYGIKDVQIAIPEALYQNLMAQEAKTHKVYEYLQNAAISNTAFSEYKVLNADGTFSKMITETVRDTDATVTLSSGAASYWGQYTLEFENLDAKIGEGEGHDATTEYYLGAVITAKDSNGVEKKYGMKHLNNLWFSADEISFCISDFEEYHGNHPGYLHTADLEGKTITNVTYLLKNQPDVSVDCNVYVKKQTSASVSAASPVYEGTGSTVSFQFKNVPTDAAYTVSSVTKNGENWWDDETLDPSAYSYHAQNGVLTVKAKTTAGSHYTVNFASEKYVDLSTTFDVATKANNKVTTAFSSKTLTYSTKKQTVNLKAKARGNAKLTYSSNNSKVKVSSGKVTIPAKFVGKVTITITASPTKEYNKATKTVVITVNPTKTSLSSVTNKKGKKMTVKWKKNATVTGYQIQYSTKKDFSKAKSVTVSKKGTTSKTISKLTKGKKYYVRVRTYKTVSGKKYYSGWSKAKSVSIRK